MSRGGRALRERPAREILHAVVGLKKDAVERVVGEPRGVLIQEPSEELGASPASVPLVEAPPGRLEQLALEGLHLTVVHRARAQGGEVALFRDPPVLGRGQFREPRGVGRDRRGIEREGAQHIVGAVVAARLVHGEDLHRAEVVSRRPLDHFREGLRVADAEIMAPPQREERDEESGDFLFWVDGHGWMPPPPRVGPSWKK